MSACPVCGDGGGFHLDDCGAAVQVPRHLLLHEKVEAARVRLTDEEIAQRRADAAARKAAEADRVARMHCCVDFECGMVLPPDREHCFCWVGKPLDLNSHCSGLGRKR